ncbi:MAG: hypothetical protein COV59_03320 [Candidatus Magasanikbacteria bacterium CG11_big_fil_rev_8_21_14_0_20_39_34]|uniref:SHS2 domain-containing protein n=1 Tax=Candidatus Magasanikbacteria bacterium CG11_big_fil_rev_8_21_14_0_20_39_34 TaxID=1974653 RepID=A0A2H0N5M7_9BACT|nr:MAG: hypothetical protein COV59_03320 [Candidatus Magasanikbacteria bacterium CG11_big_fil_rev_8_21_14_0_20_39_34]
MFGKNKSDSFLGVDIGAGGIKLVELKKTKGRPQLWTYGLADADLDVHLHGVHHDELAEEPMPEIHQIAPRMRPEMEKEEPKKQKSTKFAHFEDDARVEKYGAILKQLLKEAKVTSSYATASLPVSYIFHALVTLPKVDEKELNHHIRAKIKKMLPNEIDDMQIVFQKVPDIDGRDPKFFKYLVTAAPKQLVAFYTAIFEKAGLQLQELETEAFALARALVGLDKSTSMIVDIGAERTNFFIVDQGLPMTHRSIQMGGQSIDTILAAHLGVDQKLAQQIKLDISDQEKMNVPDSLFHPVIDPIIKEIEYSFNLFLKQNGNEEKKPEKIILTGGSAVFPLFKDFIEQRFPMRVFVGDPWARVVYQQGLKSVLDTIGPRMGVTIGLAMRNIV